MADPAYPRKPTGGPYQVLFHWDDDTGEKELALGPNGVPLVWVVDMNDSRNPEDWTVEEAPSEIAAAGWDWIRGEDA
jgi:hypothetical protein